MKKQKKIALFVGIFLLTKLYFTSSFAVTRKDPTSPTTLDQEES